MHSTSKKAKIYKIRLNGMVHDRKYEQQLIIKMIIFSSAILWPSIDANMKIDYYQNKMHCMGVVPSMYRE